VPRESTRRPQGSTSTTDTKRYICRPATASLLGASSWLAKIPRPCGLACGLFTNPCLGRQMVDVRPGRTRILCGALEPVGQHGGGGLPREPWIVGSEAPSGRTCAGRVSPASSRPTQSRAARTPRTRCVDHGPFDQLISARVLTVFWRHHQEVPAQPPPEQHDCDPRRARRHDLIEQFAERGDPV
jgi:hypothetical protein